MDLLIKNADFERVRRLCTSRHTIWNLLCVKIDYNHWQAWGLWNSRIYDSQTGYVTLDLVEVGLKLCAATELREVRRS